MMLKLLLAVTVSLSWQAPNSPVSLSGYRIFVKDASSPTYQLAKQVPASETSTTLSVDLNTPKMFMLRAYNAFGESGNSNEITAGYPGVPSSLIVSP